MWNYPFNPSYWHVCLALNEMLLLYLFVHFFADSEVSLLLHNMVFLSANYPKGPSPH